MRSGVRAAGCFCFLAVAACTGDKAFETEHPSGQGGQAGTSEAAGAAGTAIDVARPNEDAAAPPDAAPSAPPSTRVVFVVHPLGIYHPKLKVTFAGTSEDEGFERSLVANDIALSEILAPFAPVRKSLVVVDGLTNHASLNAYFQGSSDAIDDMGRYSVLTGTMMGYGRLATAAATPLNALLATFLQPRNPLGAMVLHNFGPFASIGQRRFSTAHDVRVDLLLNPELTATSRRCVQNSPDSKRPIFDAAEWVRSAFDIAADALRCDATRVATVEIPMTLPGFAGDVHQDCADRSSVMESPCFTAYNVWVAGLVAAFAQKLDAIPDGEGTLLDRTLIVWISTEGGPAHQAYPWNAILVGGQAMGLRGGRYLRVPQNVPTEETFKSGSPISKGASHNHLLVSIAQLMGLDINHVGDTMFKQRTLPPIDATGPVKGL